MSYFDELRKRSKEPLFTGTTIEKFEEDFRLLIDTHLDAMSEWLDSTDSIIQKVFENFGKTVADVFSDKFNEEVDFQSRFWMSNDEFFRREFKNLYNHYKKHLKIADMRDEADLAFEKLDAKLKEHIKKANKFGKNWTERADNAGLIVNPKSKRTINWFANLTLEELKQDYLRDLN